MPRFKNLTGQRFGKLLVVRFAGVDKWHSNTVWECVCDCGNIAVVRSGSLRSGHTKSCGCFHVEMAMRLGKSSQHKIIHGHAKRRGCKPTRTYESWAHLIDRCLNPKNERYASYGGRGIRVCDRWKSFCKFPCRHGRATARVSN